MSHRPPALAASVLVLATALTLPAIAGEEGAAATEPAWRVGQTIDTIIDTKTTNTQHLPDGSTQEIRQSLRRLNRIVVTAVDAEGTATCRLTFARMVMKYEDAMSEVEFDSEDPERRDVEHPAVQNLKAFLGVELTVRLNRRGECVSLRGTDRIVERLIAAVPAAQRAAAEAMVRASLNDETMRKQFNQAYVMPPDGAAAGAAWTERQETILDFATISMSTRFEVTEVEGDDVSIASTSRLIGGVANPALPYALDFAGLTGRGTMKVRRNHPLLIDADSTIEIRATARGAFEVPLTIKMVTRSRARLVD